MTASIAPLFSRLLLAGTLLMLSASALSKAQAPAAAEADFTRYIAGVEARLNQEHRSGQIQISADDRVRMMRGDLLIEKQTPAQDADPPGAMLHDWCGTAFAPGATAADFEQLMRNFPAYTQVYAPQVVRAAIHSRSGDQYNVTMRVKQKHALTVVMDTAYEVRFSRSDAARGWSASRSTSIREIADPGTTHERSLSPAEEHGFLWRLNTYWTYEERDGGLYLQIESVSLTKSIPTGLGWAVRPFVESVPRESLEFTLRKTCERLEKHAHGKGVSQ